MVISTTQKHRARYKQPCQLLKKMRRNLCQRNGFFNPDWRVSDWEDFCGDRKENRNEFGFHERQFCREKQQTFKSRSPCSAEAFYVLTLNGIGLDWIGWRRFYTLTLTKINQISGSQREESHVDFGYFLGCQLLLQLLVLYIQHE